MNGAMSGMIVWMNLKRISLCLETGSLSWKEGLTVQNLFTYEGETLTGQPWKDYPRPQMVRKEWLCLNGDWEFEHCGSRTSIRVPYCPESLLSGYHGEIRYGKDMLYRRTFSIPQTWHGKHVLLHFGAVSRHAEIFLNQALICSHDNGYLPFTVDVTEHLLPEKNELILRVVNDLSPRYPWGKQKKKRGGMWYTPVSGIWQTVWAEPVPEQYIRKITVHTEDDRAELYLDGVQEGTVAFGTDTITVHDGHASISIADPVFWSPEQPHLYPITITAGEDIVRSYFALRTLDIRRIGDRNRLCLNGRPYFFHGLLDQGYWSDGLYTPPTPEGYASDILSMKALGFNTLRKHIKVEPERFYYDCDRLGMIVFQDMVNCGVYHYIRDTVLPTIGLQKRKDSRLNRDPDTRKHFLSAMEETAEHLHNHPCICLYTVFNEGWGQFQADHAYHMLKKLEPGRFVNATSGWFHQQESDVFSLHIYFDRLHLGESDRPQLLSEFGGYSYKLPAHSFNLNKTYGYRKYQTREEFVDALRKVYIDEVLPLIPDGLCGAVYTQVSDVEDETNGILTYDRRVKKIEAEEFQDVSRKLCAALAVQP